MNYCSFTIIFKCIVFVATHEMAMAVAADEFASDDLQMYNRILRGMSRYNNKRLRSCDITELLNNIVSITSTHVVDTI